MNPARLCVQQDERKCRRSREGGSVPLRWPLDPRATCSFRGVCAQVPTARWPRSNARLPPGRASKPAVSSCGSNANVAWSQQNRRPSDRRSALRRVELIDAELSEEREAVEVLPRALGIGPARLPPDHGATGVPTASSTLGKTRPLARPGARAGIVPRAATEDVLAATRRTSLDIAAGVVRLADCRTAVWARPGDPGQKRVDEQPLDPHRRLGPSAKPRGLFYGTMDGGKRRLAATRGSNQEA